MIKAIIFDVNKVLVSIDVNALYINFATRMGIEPQLVIRFHRDNFPALLLGEISFEQSLRGMGIGSTFRLDEVMSIWVEEASKIRTVNQPLLDMVDLLRKNYTLAILTNLSESRIPVDEKIGLYDHFDHLILSCREHLKKPDEAFYRVVLERTGTEPNEAIFIDDKETNVLAAEKLGIQGVVFQDNEQLKRALLDSHIRF